MLRPFGPGLPSDAIVHRFGFDGNEPREVEGFCARRASLGIRSTFAINNYYPEIAGHHFVNRALIELIDRAIRSIGILPVNFEFWRNDGLVPIEGEGQLLELESYALVVQPQSQIGALNIWACYAGGGGPYYKDNVILDFLLPEEATRQLVDEVEARCRAASVRFTREPAAAPPAKGNLKSRFISFLMRR